MKFLMGISLILLGLCGQGTAYSADRTYTLDLDTTNYTEKTLTIGQETIQYRTYHVVYVAHPLDVGCQSMNIYVPSAYYAGKSVGKYTAQTAPIFLPNTIGGYMPGYPSNPGKDRQSSGPNAIFTALSKGYVVASPGARGSSSVDSTGKYTGKAPAGLVDLKAAVRYLRHNAKVIPGNAEKIISDGTSAGGAMSALLGATGNHPDYAADLKALGAADTRDDIFASVDYCPITDLDHADTAYEWSYNGINEFKGMNMPMVRPVNPMPADMPMGGNAMSGAPKSTQLTADQIKLSGELKALFPAYLNSLKLKTPDGKPLTLDASGEGTFKTYVKSFIIASAQKALDKGTKLSDLTWITIKDGKVTDIDFAGYNQYVGRMKVAPAFDCIDLSSPENREFGTVAVNAQHFTRYSQDHSTKSDSTLADPAIIKSLNPLYYIGTKECTTAPHWRIRYGSKDNNTSLAIETILAVKLQNSGYDVDYFIPWGVGHAGDYDLDDLFAWIDKICS